MRCPTYIKGPFKMRRSRPADAIVHYRLVYPDASVSRAYAQRYEARYDMMVDAVNPDNPRPIGLIRVIPRRASL
jgi:hypothetical protein